jgi:hypothetical protein
MSHEKIIHQETPHSIIQLILSHPDHLVSETECNQYLSQSRSEIKDGIDALSEENILAEYQIEDPDNQNKGDYPTVFVGLTTQGVRILQDHKFLRAVPVLRATFDTTEKTDKEESYLQADRPTLPTEVQEMLFFEE